MHARHEHYDALVIGSGQAGVPLATEFARAGFRTLLLDEGYADSASGHPATASLAASANVARAARRAAQFGVETGSIAVDLGKVQRRQRAVMEDLHRGATNPPTSIPGLSACRGLARFEGVDTIRIEVPLAGNDQPATARVRARHIFINTGVRATLPELPGLADVAHLDDRSALETKELPRHLLVVGGSYVGLELAQMFRRFGSRVSIVERQSRLLEREDRDVAAVVAEMLREDGIDVFVETEAVNSARNRDGGVRLQVRTPSGEHALAGSHLLVVPGHAPNTDGLALDAAGVDVDARGYVKVNDRLETNVPGIYALGGVNGGPGFSNIAFDDLRIVRANVIDRAQSAPAGRMCPYTVFTDPQLARIGLTETQAREQGRSVRVAKLPMRRVARAVELNQTQGLIKVVVDARTERILGAAALGVDSGEIMAMLQIAMIANMTCTSLRSGAAAHPTLATTLDNLFAALDG